MKLAFVQLAMAGYKLALAEVSGRLDRQIAKHCTCSLICCTRFPVTDLQCSYRLSACSSQVQALRRRRESTESRTAGNCLPLLTNVYTVVQGRGAMLSWLKAQAYSGWVSEGPAGDLIGQQSTLQLTLGGSQSLVASLCPALVCCVGLVSGEGGQNWTTHGALEPTDCSVGKLGHKGGIT